MTRRRSGRSRGRMRSKKEKEMEEEEMEKNNEGRQGILRESGGGVRDNYVDDSFFMTFLFRVVFRWFVWTCCFVR